MTGRELAVLAAWLADAKRGGEIVIYDLRGLSDVTDFFVIVTAGSSLQSRAVVLGVERGMKPAGARLLGQEGAARSPRVLMDYGEVVVHVFSPELRRYYSLESLWGDAPKVDWRAEGKGWAEQHATESRRSGS